MKLNNSSPNKCITFGLSLPRDFFSIIEKERGNTNRSKFITRVLQQQFCKDNRTLKTRNDQKGLPVDQSFHAQSTGICH
jgi:hypothetical protein